MPIRRHARLSEIAPSPEVQRSVVPAGDLDAVLTSLQGEQRMLADELERTFSEYDRTLREVAQRIVSFGARSVTPEECTQLRQEQLALWRLVRRAQAAQRSTQALSREIHEWRAHGPTEASEGHPDHPDTRVEIAESELRVRGLFETTGEAVEVEEVPMPVAPSVSTEPLPAWEHEEDTALLHEIFQQTQELKRTKNPADIAELVRGLRTLHGHLRLHDRREGRPRLRWQLGV